MAPFENVSDMPSYVTRCIESYESEAEGAYATKEELAQDVQRATSNLEAEIMTKSAQIMHCLQISLGMVIILQ